MILRAVSVGYAVPRVDFDAVVHSVFHSAVNLKPIGKNRLITLLALGETDLPQGIRLDTPNGFSFEELPVGIRGTCRGGILNLENFPLTVDLRKAKYWENNLLNLNADMINPKVVTAWQSAWQALNARQINSESELVARDLLSQASKKSILIQRTSKSLHNILVATQQCNLIDDDEIGALIGLGNGLTPSGDDILVGYLAGLWCTVNGKRERLDFLSALSDTVIRLSVRTNDISQTYLYHAAKGYVSSRLVALANAVCTGLDLQKVHECTESAMQVGHTSGMDAVTGLLMGLSAWDGKRLLSNENCENPAIQILQAA